MLIVNDPSPFNVARDSELMVLNRVITGIFQGELRYNIQTLEYLNVAPGGFLGGIKINGKVIVKAFCYTVIKNGATSVIVRGVEQ